MGSETHKKYMSLEQVSRSLQGLFSEMARRNSTLIPSERELSERIGCSRKTLRIALESLEASGSVVKGMKGRSLSLSSASNAKLLGGVAFLTIGDGFVSNPAWNKLSEALKAEAPNRNIACEVIALPGQVSAKGIDFERMFSKSQFIVVANNFPDPEMLKGILSLKGRHFITVEESLKDVFKGEMIAVDNYAGGRLCAEALASSGYRKPLGLFPKLVYRGHIYDAFAKRAQGFKDTCLKLGLDYSESDEVWVESPNKYAHLINLIKAIERIPSGRDSLFLFSDDDIELLYEALAQDHKIPEPFGFVTVNSFSYATSHNPPISSAGHATKAVSSAILDAAGRFFKKPEGFTCGTQFLTPNFHKGATLR